MGIINVEIYSVVILAVLLIDYLFKFHKVMNVSSRLWSALNICTMVIAISNIGFTLSDHYVMRLVATVVYLLSTLVSSLLIYIYIKYTYINSNLKLKKEILLSISSIIVCVLFTLTYLFWSDSNYIAHSFNRLFLNKLLIFAIIPNIIALISYIIHCLSLKIKLNYKIFLTFIITILGMIFDMVLDNLFFVSATYTLTTLIIYINKHERLLNTDPLTGLANKRSLDAFLVNLKHDLNIGVYNMDIDKFKLINDNYGHLKGDYVLKAFSKILRDSTRDRDLVIRNGGDEFLIIAEIRNEQDATKIIERINENLKAYNKTADIKIEMSLGWGIYKCEGENLADEFSLFLKKIDEKMYIEKEKKKKKALKKQG